jgi:hypothetical protein
VTRALHISFEAQRPEEFVVTSTAKLSRWTGEDGADHTGLAVTAHRLMSKYAATRRRRAQADERTPA